MSADTRTTRSQPSRSSSGRGTGTRSIISSPCAEARSTRRLLVRFVCVPTCMFSALNVSMPLAQTPRANPRRLSRAVTMPVEAPESRSSQALPPPPPDPSTDTERARRRGLFVPAFARLVESIQGRVRYPEDFANWRKDERADFRRARYAVADTLVEAAAVLGGEATLNLLVRPLSELSASTANGGSFDWREAEAALYCIRSVAKEAPPPTSQLLGNILRALPTLPLVPEVQYTCALVIGAHSDWISKAAACGTVPPELAGALLEHLMRVMEMGGSSETGNDARSAAALALKHVCDAGVTRISPAFLQPLLVVYRRVLVRTDRPLLLTCAEWLQQRRNTSRQPDRASSA